MHWSNAWDNVATSFWNWMVITLIRFLVHKSCIYFNNLMKVSHYIEISIEEQTSFTLIWGTSYQIYRPYYHDYTTKYRVIETYIFMHLCIRKCRKWTCIVYASYFFFETWDCFMNFLSNCTLLKRLLLEEKITFYYEIHAMYS